MIIPNDSLRGASRLLIVQLWVLAYLKRSTLSAMRTSLFIDIKERKLWLVGMGLRGRRR